MKKLNITKEQFNKSRYFTKKYGKLEYVSESGRMFKTDKGNVLMFKESSDSMYDGLPSPEEVYQEPADEWPEEDEEYGNPFEDTASVMDRICGEQDGRDPWKWIIGYPSENVAYFKMIKAFGGGLYKVTIEEVNPSSQNPSTI